ncbi:MAG: glycoside hydrolase family 38 C-terminal domain-containing protein [Candidatus Promineifilaceae bacterium]
MQHPFEKLNHLTNSLKAYIYRDAVPLQNWAIVDKLAADEPMLDVEDGRFQPLPPGQLWGAHSTWAWLKTSGVLPRSFAGKPAVLRVRFEELAEAGSIVYSATEALAAVPGSSIPLQALNESHPDIWLSDSAEPGTITITLACFTGISLPGEMQVRLKTAEFAWLDRDVEGLYWDARVLLDSIAQLPPDLPERSHYLRELDRAFNQLNWLNPPDEAFCASVKQARQQLRQRVYRHTSQMQPDGIRPTVHAIGHAHIDLAWLWPLRVTRGKAVRTAATAVSLMHRFPDYKFTQSQVPLYQMVAADNPDLFAQIKACIAAGQWNATGATWVEMDANLPSGESLVRQFLYGMRYFQRELGVRPELLWLPDGFGFSAALPQIMQQAGIRYFFTNKLSWNDHAKQPHDTFWWEGIDGSRVLAHLGTTPETVWDVGRARAYATYVAQMTPEEILGTWTRYRQKGANQQLLIPFGMGDGGGGPNREMLERRERLANLPGLPQVVHSSAEAFFQALEANLTGDLPRWVGELYLQFHRGTFTTHGRTKRFNRTSEGLLHDLEALASLRFWRDGHYPQEAINHAWETVMLNQFHDILPGSSVREVHEEAEQMYAEMQTAVRHHLHQTITTLADHIQAAPQHDSFVAFNTLGNPIGGPIELVLPGQADVTITDPAGTSIPYQWLNQAERRALVLLPTVPAYGYAVYTVHPAAAPAETVTTRRVSGTPTSLENDLLRAEFDEKGNLIRLFDREHQREVLAAGSGGNQLWAYVDRPTQFDAWEVEAYLHDQGWQLTPTACRLIENGPVRATLEVTYRFNHSQIRQRISLTAGQRLLTFATEVDWHERHIMLQTHFPLAIRARHATYEIQFGTIERPTHTNTLWDEAQFEVPAQQWVDLSEAGYGVSLLNDGKYGHRAQDNVLTLSLLRSPTEPDPEADQGAHQFTYALYPHRGDWREGTIWQARRLNHPLYGHAVEKGGGKRPSLFSLVACQTPGVIIDTVKKAEDGNSLIVRVYEGHGGRCRAELTFSSSIDFAEEVTLLEAFVASVSTESNTLAFDLTPYQLRSFRIHLSAL